MFANFRNRIELDAKRREQFARLQGEEVMTHTATPWQLARHGAIVGGLVREYVNGNGQDQIALACVVPEDNGDQMANAAFIVRACNSHDDLVGAGNAAQAALFELIRAYEKVQEWHGLKPADSSLLVTAKATNRNLVAALKKAEA